MGLGRIKICSKMGWIYNSNFTFIKLIYSQATSIRPITNKTMETSQIALSDILRQDIDFTPTSIREELEALISTPEWRLSANIPTSRPLRISEISESDNYFQTEDIFGAVRWWKY